MQKSDIKIVSNN